MEVLARVAEAAPPTTRPEAAIPEGCRRETEIDEYGFEIEVVVCDPDPTSTTTPDSGGTTSTTAAVPESTVASTIPAEPLPLAGWPGSDHARALMTALREVIVGQTGCEQPGSLIELATLAANAPTEIRDPLQGAVADLQRMAEICDSDVRRWRDALEAALNDLDAVADILEAAAGE
jgi:hypothetical protein